jgi:hypothetical protein
MRTTLKIDDDVLLAVKERARREGRTAGEVLSELARQSLTGGSQQRTSRRRKGVHGFHPLPHRGPAVTNSAIDQLREEEPG